MSPSIKQKHLHPGGWKKTARGTSSDTTLTVVEYRVVFWRTTPVPPWLKGNLLGRIEALLATV